VRARRTALSIPETRSCDTILIMALRSTVDREAPGVAARIRFDRNELSGAFGDIGADFPLIVGMILAARLDAASVLVMFGAMQIMTGLLYGMPMPAQPLKAMAVLVITQQLGATSSSAAVSLSD